MIRRKIAALCVITSSLYGASGHAADPDGLSDRLQLQHVDASMSADEYKHAYRNNRRHVVKFAANYSEDTLLALGVSKSGVRALGVVAGAAMTQAATVYLNTGKTLLIDIKDAAQDDRAIFFAIKRTW